jgi:hypothetical protein
VSSQLVALITQIAALELVVEGRLVPVRGLTNPLTIANGPFPLRIQHLYSGSTQGLSGSGEWQKVLWSVADLCILSPTSQGAAPPTLAIARIAAAYTQLPVELRTLAEVGTPPNRLAIRNKRITPNVYEWPLLSGNTYHGVELVIDIEEFLI